MFSRIRTCSWAGLLTLLVLPAEAGMAQEVRQQPPRLRESVFLETDNSAVMKLEAARDYLRADQWGEAIDLLSQILEDHSEKLVPVGIGRYVNLRSFCHTLLATMSAEGLKAYRRRIDPQAKQWFEAGMSSRDEMLLLKVVKHAFVSNYGDDALLVLGELSWERGDFGQARSYWEKALPIQPAASIQQATGPGEPLPLLTYPDTDLDRALIRAKLILCSLMQRNPSRLQRELAAFAQLHPDAQGTFAGRSGRLVQTLAAVVEAAGSWSYPEAKPDIATFAFNSRRNKVLPQAVDDIGAVQWSQPLLPIRTRLRDRLHNFLHPVALSYFPVNFGDIVLLNDENAIYAYDLQTGKPAWPVGETDDAVIYPPLPHMGRIADLSLRTIGIPRFTMTVDQGRLYARMGSPITGRGRFDVLQSARSHLVCLDLARGQGKVQWVIEARQIDPRESDWEFEGSPVVENGRLFVALRKSTPQPQSNIACYDAETGKLIWNQKICTALATFAEGEHKISHNLLTLAESTLFYSTGLGAIAALDAHDGTLKWVVTYERKLQGLQDLGLQIALEFKDGLTPCVYHAGTIFAAPTDLKKIVVPGADRTLKWMHRTQGQIIALHAASGLTKWTKELPGGVRHLLGVADGKLIAAGDFLWAIDVDTGKTMWRTGDRDPESHSFGRGLLADGLVFWPQREEIAVLNVANGQPHRRLVLGQWRQESGGNLTGGNLAIAGGFLLVAQEQRLVVYSQWGRRKQQIKQLITAQPQDPALRFQLAQAEEATGQLEAALTEYRKSFLLSTPTTRHNLVPLKDLAARKLYQLLCRVAQRATEDENYARAIDCCREAANVAVEQTSRMTALLQLARAHEADSNPVEAVAAYQTVLNQPPMPTIRDGRKQEISLQARSSATGRIAALIKEHGRDIFASHQQQAWALIERAFGANDLEAALAVLRQFPHAQVPAEAWFQLAERYLARSELNSVARTYEYLLRNNHSAEDRKLALSRLARTFELQKYWRSAAARWKQLSAEFQGETMPHGGESVLVEDFVARRLRQEDFRRQQILTNSDQVAIPLSRQWNDRFAADSIAIVPESLPPSLSARCVLVSGDGLRCLELADGSIRWQMTRHDQLTWAGYTESRLLLADAQGLYAVSLDRGTNIWQRKWNLSPARPERDLQNPDPLFFSNDNILCMTDDGRIFCVDHWDGSVVWQFRPPSGKLQRRWFHDAEHIVVQTLNPNKLLVLNITDGRVVAEAGGPELPWSREPSQLRDGFVTLTAGTDRIDFHETATAIRRWTYPGPISQANATPDFLTDGNNLILVIDGDTLVNVKPETGKKIWSRWLGSNIVRDARYRVSLDDQSVYTAAAGIVRCFWLPTGKLKWEAYVGSRDTPWCLKHSGRYLAVYPRSLQTQQQFSVLFCDAQTGAYIQTMNFPAGNHRIRMHTGPEITILTAGSQVFALGPMSLGPM